MKKQPLVSIITPSFHQAQYLEETINSVLNQDYEHIEYIIIDGGSQDGSVDIIKKYADRLAYWVSEPDLGQTDAINKGFAKATGEILAYINSDDIYYPGAVSSAVAALKKNHAAAGVYGDANFIDGGGKIIGKFAARQTDHKRLRQGYVHIPQQSTFFRAMLWQMVGPLDPSFYFAMDYDLWVRLTFHSPLIYVPDSWSAFRLHEDAKSVSAMQRCWPEMVRVHLRDGGSKFSIIYTKYLLRKLVEPMMPLRLKTRLMIQRISRMRSEEQAQ